MKLVTWNVNSLKARMPRVLEFLGQHAPDVACLQETKCDAQQFPEAELAQAGYRSIHHSGGRWAGVALLVRDGLDVSDPVYGLQGEVAHDEARWVEATIDGVRIASVYVPNGREVDSPTYAEKLTFLEAMAQRAPQLDVIAGDMNVAPSDVDVYDPSVFEGATHVTAAERTRLAAVMQAGGLVDAYRVLHPEPEVGYTWWDYRQGHFHRGMGLRIDLVLVDAEKIAPRLRSVGIDRDFRKGAKPSDHAPLLVAWS
jgi:exodeoxyribonuclease-3